ncbi:MAG: hypothetical protein U0L42_04325 [Methanobrevibacter sp.]|uniref:hypothetical protein n=1 Tax=Methanobrevibacter sp. TaxID=66852 RepID=UPI002E780E4B|nr:hypothetical protein [Methanobrevibacter sp.]MEE0934878.1 hypothetical protein [Methanobrevibacter sp.]
MKRIFLILTILLLILTVNVAFAENETVSLNEDIYVSVDGSDSLGDGSADNPYQTLNYTIEKASDNANIYLKSGVYNSTGYEITNKSISITGIGDVTIDGGNGKVSQNMFKVNNNSSLVLNNIKFVNGYTDLSSLSSIINEGRLYINDCEFNNFSTVNCVIKNNNYLYANNISSFEISTLWDVIYADLPPGAVLWIAQEVFKRPINEFIQNRGHCDIYNSRLLSSLVNYNTVYVTNTIVNEIFSNSTASKQNFVSKSAIKLFRCYNSTFIINDSCIERNTSNPNFVPSIEFSNIVLDNSTLDYAISSLNSNFTATSCVFNFGFTFSNSNANVSYSTVLASTVYITNSVATLNYNWWGKNKAIPISNTNSRVVLDYWIVMTFVNETDSMYRVNLNQYTNGATIFDLKDITKFNSRLVKLETETGHFSKNNQYLANGTLQTKLIGNNPDTLIYATIDSQVLRLAVGTGLSNYSIYVSNDDGNDYFYDGSGEYPYKTLSKAVSVALSGNRIYILEGNYTLSWNANLKINKNLTFIGVGNAQLLRPNARNIFIVQDKGILNIENVNFTVATTDNYVEPLIMLNRGDLNVNNCNFYNIKTQGVIMAKNNEFIKLNHVSFDHITGPAILGFSNTIIINNSVLSNGFPIYLPMGQYGYTYNEGHTLRPYSEFYIWAKSNTTIVNTIFRDNIVGIIASYSHAGTQELYKFWNLEWGVNNKPYTYIYNSTFIDNNWDKLPEVVIGLAIGSNSEYYRGGFGLIDGCLFENNIGHILYADNITNSKFINNTATPYLLRTDADFSSKASYVYPKALLTANYINNSYFYGNSFLSRDYEEKVVGANEVYYSTFINNSAAYGGALSGPSEVHYCVFINNTATYDADDIFVYKGDLNASGNWWGSNQNPGKRVHVFIGKLTLNNWVIMNLNYVNGSVIAALDNLLDTNENIKKFNHTLPSRLAIFSSEAGELNPKIVYLVDNYAYSELSGKVSQDFNVYATIDNQKLNLTVYNDSTDILIRNMTLYGKDNPFNITLINVNGHRISSQVLKVAIYKGNVLYDSFTLTTDDRGNAGFNIDYPIGEYIVNVYYAGNGYFAGKNATSTVKISSITTHLTSYNYTYYGKSNKFYAILRDNTGRYVLNQDLTLQIYDSKNKLLSTTTVKTGTGGRADVLLSLDVGKYKLKWTYEGNEWYSSSSSISYIQINPINTTIYLLNATFYGRGNDYELTFKDAYGTLIHDETIILTISNGNVSRDFSVVVDDVGIGSININLEPGIYNVCANYLGDEVYGPSNAFAILDIQPVRVTFDLKAHTVIPENGVFTSALVDMYGKKVTGENVTLELYDDGLLKTYHTVTDANGEANFRIDMGEGIYLAILSYNGSTWYRPATGAAKITVNPSVALNNIYINASDFVQYYGENKYFLINFNDTNAYSLEGRMIKVSISSKDWSKSYNVESDAFGKVRLQITLEPGEYNITYKYVNEYYDIHGVGSNSIIVYKMPTSILASDLVMNHGQPQYFEVKLVDKNGNALPSMIINITVDGKSYEVVTNQKGIAKYLIDLGIGSHNITYSFKSEFYGLSNGSSRVLVVDGNKTVTKLMADDVVARQDELVNYEVLLTDLVDLPIISSEIIVNVTDLEGNFIGSYSGFTNASGIARFNLNLTYGQYNVNAHYNGNGNYLPSSNANNIHVKAVGNVIETILFGNDFTVVNGDNSTNYHVILSTLNGEFLQNQEIEFVIKGNTYHALTDGEGIAYLNVPFTPGAYKVVAKFYGADNLTKAYVTNYISVKGETCYLYSMDVIKSFNNATQYYVALVDSNNLPLADKVIKFYINNETYEALTDINGFACFDKILAPGTYNITAIYQGNYPDEFAQVNNNITVLTTVVGENIVNYGGVRLPVRFLDNLGNNLSNTEVYFIVNDLGYKVNTDSNGIGVFNYNLKVGSYDVMAINSLSGENKTFNLKIVKTIVSGNLVKYYKGSQVFKATFKDKNGNLLKNTKVKFTVNGKSYSVKTNAKGVATLKINLKPGKYTITSLNTNTGEKASNKINVKTIIISKNKSVKANKKINYQVKILKTNGKVAKKVTIKFKINKKTYKVKTNSKGVAKLNIKLKKGKYTVKTTYNGLTVKNKIIVKK